MKGGDKLRDNIEPREEPVEIPQSVEKGTYYARRATGTLLLLLLMYNNNYY